MKSKQNKPNCYECQYRGEIPGDAHSCCKHPDAGADLNNPMGSLMAIFAGVGRGSPIQGGSSQKMNVTFDDVGIRNGWANFPWGFDPVWLLSCNGFKKKAKKKKAKP